MVNILKSEYPMIRPTGFLYRKYKNDIYPNISFLPGTTKLAHFLERREISNIVDGVEVTEQEDLYHTLIENDYIRIFKSVINENSIVCDVGAHHGIYSILGLKGKKVHGFEISTDNFEKALKNLKLNTDDEADFDLVRKPVWDKEEKISIEDKDSGTNQVGKGSKELEAISLDKYFSNKEDPDIIKIDVEGAEGQVLKGSEKLLKRSKPKLFIEFHTNNRLDSFGYSFLELKSFLEDLDYDFPYVEERGSQRLVVAK